MATSNAATPAQQKLGSQEKIAKLEGMYAGWISKFPDANSIKADRLKAMIEEDQAGTGARPLLLVDVRAVEETNVSVIASKNTLLKDEFERRMDEFKDHTVVCYCTAGYRSGMFCNEVLSKGFPQANLFNLEGSILAASQHGLAMMVRKGTQGEDGSFPTEPTNRVHVWGPTLTELLAEGYSPVLPPPQSYFGFIVDVLWKTWSNALLLLRRPWR